MADDKEYQVLPELKFKGYIFDTLIKLNANIGQYSQVKYANGKGKLALDCQVRRELVANVIALWATIRSWTEFYKEDDISRFLDKILLPESIQDYNLMMDDIQIIKGAKFIGDVLKKSGFLDFAMEKDSVIERIKHYKKR